MQVAKVENGTRNIEQKNNKRKIAKEFNADKSTVGSSITNALDDGDTKHGGDASDRPRKKGGRRKLKKNQKKSQQRSDGFFCGAPSEY